MEINLQVNGAQSQGSTGNFVKQKTSVNRDFITGKLGCITKILKKRTKENERKIRKKRERE